jgi:hypothetical protein
MKTPVGSLKEKIIVGVTCWVLKSHLFKALVLPSFTYGIEICGGNLKILIERFQERHEDTFDASHQSACFDNLLYFVGRIWRTSHGIICSKVN